MCEIPLLRASACSQFTVLVFKEQATGRKKSMDRQIINSKYIRKLESLQRRALFRKIRRVNLHVIRYQAFSFLLFGSLMQNVAILILCLNKTERVSYIDVKDLVIMTIEWNFWNFIYNRLVCVVYVNQFSQFGILSCLSATQLRATFESTAEVDYLGRPKLVFGSAHVKFDVYKGPLAKPNSS